MNSTISTIFDKLNLMGLYPIYRSINNSTIIYRDSSKTKLLYEVIEDGKNGEKYIIRRGDQLLGDNMIDSQVIEFIKNDMELSGVVLKENITVWDGAIPKRLRNEPATPSTITRKREISLDLDEEE